MILLLNVFIAVAQEHTDTGGMTLENDPDMGAGSGKNAGGDK